MQMRQEMRGVPSPLERAGRSRSQRPDGSVAEGTHRNRAWRFGTLARVVVVCFAVLLLGSGATFACGPLKMPPGAQKNGFVAYGEVIFVGSADYWESSFDPEVDTPINLLVDGSPGTDAAREHLDLLDVELGAVASLQSDVGSASSIGTLTVHSVSSLTISMGELTFSDFGSMQMESSEGGSSPFPHKPVATACDALDPCDWVWGYANSPIGVDPTGTSLTLDSSIPLSGAPQHGVTFYYGGVPGTLPINAEELAQTTTVTTPSYVLVDLDVPDLPATWQSQYGTNVRVVFRISDGVYYDAVSVPAMSGSGGVVLILGVLGLGFLALAWPARRVG